MNALVVAFVEFVGGICLVLGIATQVVSAPLAFIMLIAILTAQIQTVSTLGDFLYLPEVPLLAILIWFIFSGPGKVSLGTILWRRSD